MQHVNPLLSAHEIADLLGITDRRRFWRLQKALERFRRRNWRSLDWFEVPNPPCRAAKYRYLLDSLRDVPSFQQFFHESSTDSKNKKRISTQTV